MFLFIKKHFLLLAATVALLGAIGSFLVSRGATGPETYLDSVEERLDRALFTARQDMNQILGLLPIDDGKPFSTLFIDSPNPYFLYRDSTLIFWSDYRFTPDYAFLNQARRDTQAIETPQGQFLILTQRKRLPSGNYELFMLIKLYSKSILNPSLSASAYNPVIFPIKPRALQLAPGRGSEVSARTGEALFYVDPPDARTYHARVVTRVCLVLISLAIMFLGLYVVGAVRRLRIRHRYTLGLAVLLFFLIVVRGLMLRFSIPMAFHEGTIFNPQNYRSSLLVPSLGDLLLNALVVLLVLLYINGIYFRTITYRKLTRSGKAFQMLVSLLILLVSYVAYYLCYRELINIYERSFFILDITLSIGFSPLKLTALLVFVTLSGIYFMIVHLVASVFIRLNPSRPRGVAILLASAFITAFVSWGLNIPFEWVFLVHLAYLLVLYFTRLPRAFYGFRYPTTGYYFVGALVCALMTTYIVSNQEIKQDIQEKKDYGSQLLSANDLYTEFLLRRNEGLIAKDSTLRRLFSEGNPLARELIQQHIRADYLNQYLSQYDIEVLSFDGNGAALDNTESVRNYAAYEQRYRKPEYQTADSTVYLVRTVPEAELSSTDSANAAKPIRRKQYLDFIEITDGSRPLGYLVLDLLENRPLSRDRYPETTLDERFVQVPQTGEYSYAIFENKIQQYSSGAYNYERKFPGSLLLDPSLYEKGIILNGYRHVGLAGDQGRRVVVSSISWEWKGLLANFSFLYLILVVVVLLAIAGHALRYGLADLPLTYSTKLQVLLNAAFILPLLIVLFFVLKVIGNNYEANQRQSYLSNTHNISANVLGYLDEFEQGRMSNAYFEQQVQQIARDAQLDINLYDTTGHMLLSSNPLAYQSGLLSKLINPLAHKQIIEQKEGQVLLNESLGDRSYKTAYSGLKSYDQRLLGVISVPFFDSIPSLNRQIIDIVASILIVFTAMLLVFLLVSYLASNLLLEPLRTLTRKISITSLNQPNEPLPWHSNDEIGALTRKYNQMLVNLEMSKKALSNNEKQSAWRDMARQVAHEIKNPLTPMKLTLQQLQRTISRDDPDALEKVGRAMESIIEQIGYIAQSFSDIAKMPPPQNEVFEVTSVLHAAYELYAGDRTINFQKEVARGPIFVSGDRKQFSASINNLIINASQSVPDSRSAELGMRLYIHNEMVMIEISDNGSGIAQNIKSRVFLPNFTTRQNSTGLGLAMAKRIIEYAGGSIWFETHEGAGTTFFLSMPLANKKPAA